MVHSHILRFALVLQVICLISAKVSAKDDTLVEYTKGKDVTEAVLRKMSKSEIFGEDYSFLLRLAYVESVFGEDDKTFREGYFGGIWQMEESFFQITQTNHSTLVPLHKAIQSEFQIDWMSVTWKSLVTPLYSGLAAALYFTRVAAIEVIPQNVPSQAAYWQKYYRALGQISKFIEDSEQLRNQTICRGKMDLCIVLDGSGSINQVDPRNFQRAKDFAASIIESFALDYTRFGMVVFSDEPSTIFEINNRDTIGQLAHLAREAYYPKGGTRTDLAINRAIEMFRASSGDNADSGIPKLMTVFTDGQSDRGSNISGAVDGIRNNQIKSVSIGIGSSLNPAELLEIALMDSRSVFVLEDFINLQDFLQTITSLACELPQRPTLNKVYDDALIQNEKRIYHVHSPVAEGVTVNVSVSIGTVNGYWSREEEVPSGAVHDGVIDVGVTFIPPLERRAKGCEEGDEGEPNLYISIQGVGENNSYTLSVVKGNGGGSEGTLKTGRWLEMEARLEEWRVGPE